MSNHDDHESHVLYPIIEVISGDKFRCDRRLPKVECFIGEYWATAYKSIRFPIHLSCFPHFAVSPYVHWHVHPHPLTGLCRLALMSCRYAPITSSPLASNTASTASRRPLTQRQHSFPSSPPLRPFTTITNKFPPKEAIKPKPSQKLIEPPKDLDFGYFVLNLTQAEFSRRE